MPVGDDTKAIVAAILASRRISTHGTERGATTRKAYVDEFLRMLHQLKHPDRELPEHEAPDQL
jgi:hypothetical protein